MCGKELEGRGGLDPTGAGGDAPSLPLSRALCPCSLAPLEAVLKLDRWMKPFK